MEFSIDLFAAIRAALLLAAFAGFTWALLRMRREHAEQLDRVHTSQRELIAQVHALSERTSALTTLIATLPKQVQPVQEAPQPLRSRREASPVRSYETARRLARSGATVEEIMATCGVAGPWRRKQEGLVTAKTRLKTTARPPGNRRPKRNVAPGERVVRPTAGRTTPPVGTNRAP